MAATSAPVPARRPPSPPAPDGVTADPSRLAERVEALLGRMTLEEKVGQMTQLAVTALCAPGAATTPDGRIPLDPARVHEAIVVRHVGSVINVLDHALAADGWHAVVHALQDAAATTRLAIPILYGIDFVHGANYLHGGTIVPHQSGLAATFDPALVAAIGEATSAEADAAGLRWNFAPVLDVGRQPLWPRFYETFGEDPHLAATLGAAFVAGAQRTGRVAATMKHYLGYAMPRTGRDRTHAPLTEREVRETVLPPFRAAVAAGVQTVMVNSGDIDGVPVHASRYWLTDVLRGELGFEGVVVTDWEDVGFLHTRHRVARTMRDAVHLAVAAGIDVAMTPHDFAFADELLALVRDGEVAESRVDASVRRVLRLKAALGVLDAPRPTPGAGRAIGTPAARALAQDAARRSITLLRNEAALLPLAAGTRVLVTGPGARSSTALHGGWSYTWQGDDPLAHPPDAPTLLDALAGAGLQVTHVPSDAFDTTPDAATLAAVAHAARAAEVAVVVLGEQGYAEWAGDLDDLTLPAGQLALARHVLDTGTPTVLVLLAGRPRVVRPLVDDARAIVLGYWPGPAGADALADVLVGRVNPCGRLPFTYPRGPNALLTYDHRHPEAFDAAIPRREAGGYAPEWPFGHGLSYTRFTYDGLRLERDRVRAGERVVLEVRVTNAGPRDGEETVLVYSRQHYGAMALPDRRLRRFRRVALAAGASCTVRLALDVDDLAYVAPDGRPVLEPGAFDVMVGGLTATLHVQA